MPHSAVLPGRHPTPNAIKAMPVTRATALETPVSSAPSNSRPTRDGTTINPAPVASSATAATVNSFFIELVFRAGDGFGDHLLVRFGVLRRPEIEPDLGDLAGEFERHIVAVFNRRHPGAGVLADIEVLVLGEHDGRHVVQRLLGHGLAVHEQLADATFAEARAVVLKVKQDGVFASLELRPFPSRPLKIE